MKSLCGTGLILGACLLLSACSRTVSESKPDWSKRKPAPGFALGEFGKDISDIATVYVDRGNNLIVDVGSDRYWNDSALAIIEERLRTLRFDDKPVAAKEQRSGGALIYPVAVRDEISPYANASEYRFVTIGNFYSQGGLVQYRSFRKAQWFSDIDALRVMTAEWRQETDRQQTRWRAFKDDLRRLIDKHKPYGPLDPKTAK